MKPIICFILSLLMFSIAKSQPKSSDIAAQIPIITINARLVDKDSVIIPFDQNYWIVQDSCTQIIRHGHYNFKNKTFVGKFTDVKKDDTTQIVAQGSYTKYRLKDGVFLVNYMDGKLKYSGEFTAGKYTGSWKWYYPNGVLKAAGSFKDDKYIGTWSFYYDNGNPQLSFDVENGKCLIENSWNPDGSKSVNNGNGYYSANIENSSYGWYGKITSRLPDSIWEYRDYSRNVVIANETYNTGKFFIGTAMFNGVTNSYSDESHISLFPSKPSFFELDRACLLNVVPACNRPDYPNVYVKIWGKTILNRTISMNGMTVIK
jgi:antitoxin component YwqK of YwqJK toxin-antitoxin module